MSVMAGKIFINYRRGEDSAAAGRLFDRLEQDFAKSDLFMDVDGIGAGADFVAVLERKVAECDVLLAMIGKTWLDARDAKGNRRLDSPEDFVRFEIASALRFNKCVVPVLVNGANMPAPDALPEPLKLLARRNAVRLTHECFKADAHGIVDGLKTALAEMEAERAARLEAEQLAAGEARTARLERNKSRRAKGRLTSAALCSAEELANWDLTKESPRAGDFRDHLARFAGGFSQRFPRAKLAGALALAGAVAFAIGPELNSPKPAQPVAERTAPQPEAGGKPVEAGADADAIFYDVRGDTYVENKDYDRAIADYTKAIEINPKYAKAYLHRGSAYDHENDYDRAIADYNKAIEINPKDTDYYNRRGIAYANKQEYDRAIADYTKAIEINPNYGVSYYNRGLNYAKKQEYDRAIADYTKAIEINPKDTDYYNRRGIAYANKQEYDRAIADYTKAIEINPNYGVFYYNRGLNYANKQEYDRAIADYTKAIEINPKDSDYYNRRGLAYKRKQDYDSAISDYTKAIEIDPKYDVAYYNRGLVYDAKQDYDQAIADYTKAIEINPKDSDYYNKRGNAYYNKKEYDLAIADYTKAIEIDPNDGLDYNNRGNAYKAQGKITRAAADYRRAMELGYKE